MPVSILDQFNKALAGTKVTMEIKNRRITRIVKITPPVTLEHQNNRVLACERNPTHCDEWNCCQMKEISTMLAAIATGPNPK